jgi:hypothetical protein
MQYDLMCKTKTVYLNHIIILLITIISILPKTRYVYDSPSPNNIGHIYTITTIEAWKKQGALHYHFSPVLSYDNPGDKNMYEYKRVADTEGNNYFVSFPPFSFIIAYIFSLIFYKLNINYLLTLLAGLYHLLTGIFIYLALNKLFNNNKQTINISALTGFCIIMFSQALLFHSLSWFPEISVLPVWTFFIMYIINLQYSNTLNRKNIAIAGLTGFLLCYSDWLGYFIILSFLVYIMFFNKNLIIKTAGIYLLLGGAVAMILTVFQYSQISGIQALFRGWSLRFVERSGLFGNKLSDQGLSLFNLNTWILAFARFKQTIAGIGYLSIFIILIYFFLFNRKIKKLFQNVNFILLLFIIILPVILHFILLLNSNIVHIGEWAKAYIPLSFFAAISIEKIITGYSKIQTKYTITGLIAGLILSTLVSFQKFNDIMNEYSNNTFINKCTSFIKSNVTPQEAVFIKYNPTISFYLPYIEFSVRRNIKIATDTTDAYLKMIDAGHHIGKFFEFEPDFQKGKVKKLVSPCQKISLQ